jgi:HEAT repeat protein
LFFLLATGVPAAAEDSVREARRLLISAEVKDRARGVEMLRRLDTGASIQALEEAVKRSVRDLDRLAPRVQKLDDEWVEALIYCIVFAEHGLTRTEEYREYKRTETRLRADLDAMKLEMRRHVHVIVAASEAFLGYRSAEAIEKIEVGANSEPNLMTRLFYVAGLGHETRAACVPTLLKQLEHRDARIRATAVRALCAHIDAEGVLPAVEAATQDKHWCVRLGAYQALTGAPFPKAVELLVGAAQREKGEVALAVDSYLEGLTGHSFPQRTAHWKEWWDAHRKSIAAGTYRPRTDEEAAAEQSETKAMFFHIPIESSCVVFAIDFSGSMGEECTIADETAGRYMAQYGLQPTRLGYAQAELIRALDALPDGTEFNIVGYNTKAKLFAPRLVTLNRSSRRRAVTWLRKLETKQLTNIYDALEECFRDVMGSSSAVRFNELPDTIVFLSDGAATCGRFQESEDLRDLVRLWNRNFDVVIHTVGIGEDHDRKLLAAISEETGGYYVDLDKGLRDFAPRRRRLPPGIQRGRAEAEGLRKRLEEGTEEERLAALAEIESLGPGAVAGALPAILAMLDARDDAVREAATRIVAELGDAAVAPILRGLASADAARKRAAILGCRALGEKAGPAAGALATLVGADDAALAVLAARALGAIGPAAKAAIPALESASQSGQFDLAEAATAALDAVRR